MKNVSKTLSIAGIVALVTAAGISIAQTTEPANTTPPGQATTNSTVPAASPSTDSTAPATQGDPQAAPSTLVPPAGDTSSPAAADSPSSSSPSDSSSSDMPAPRADRG